MSEYFKIYTDGGCRPNPGLGGWATIIHQYNLDELNNETVLSGTIQSSTNNRMEMVAVIEGLKAIPKPSIITVFTDSRYLERGIGGWSNGKPTNRGWICKWHMNNWRRQEGKLQNADLWESIYYKIIKHIKINVKFVPGHSGHVLNERCDKLVKLAMERAVKNDS